MTTLFSWTSVDNRGPSALYVASESRFSWGGPGKTWDSGAKLFASRTTPDLFGFSGDVLSATVLLNQTCTFLEHNALFNSSHSPNEKASRLQEFLARGFDGYPVSERAPFSIFYGTRTGERQRPHRANTPVPKIRFHLFVLDWNASDGWSVVESPMPAQSGFVAAQGSGKPVLDAHLYNWRKSDVAGTSRAAFSAFCDGLESRSDPRSGGAPQLLEIRTYGAAQAIGVVWQGKRYLLGQVVEEPPVSGSLRWINSQFEDCDPSTLERIAEGQRHPRPANIGRG